MQFADIRAIDGESSARICAASASDELGCSAQLNAQSERRGPHSEHPAYRSGAAIGEPYATLARGIAELLARQCASARFGNAQDERKRQDDDASKMTESASSIANGAPVVQPTLVGGNVERHANSRSSVKKSEAHASISRENVAGIDEFLELIVLRRSSPSGQRVCRRVPEFRINLPFVAFPSRSKSSMRTTVKRTHTCARRRGASLRLGRANRLSTARRCNLSNSNKSPNRCVRRLVVNLDSRVQLGEKFTSPAGAIPTRGHQCIAFETSVHNQTAFVRRLPIISNPNARTLMRTI